MAASPVSGVIQHLRQVVLAQDGTGMTDGQLLECFVGHKDEAALEVLVRRHGPMVWGVCRRLLGNHHDAEDAFQATFVVLVRKAASIVPREMVANWLYGVARQVARKAQAMAVKRGTRERQVTEMPEPKAGPKEPPNDLQPLLDQELSHLPDKYRVAIILCDLEGKTRKEAARQVGVPEGTLSAWVARARAMLAKRLARHGVILSGGALAAVLSHDFASAVVPSPVVSSTIKAVTLVAAGNGPTAGVISAQVAALTEGVLKAMLITKLKTVTAVLFLVAILGAGISATFGNNQAPVVGQTVKREEQKQVVFGNKPPPGAKVTLVSGKTDTIEVPQEAFARMGIHVGQVKERGEAPPQQLKALATLNYDQDRLFVIRSRFPGELAEIRQVMDTDKPNNPPRHRPMRIGDKVKQGEVLGVLWSKDLGMAKADLVDAIVANKLSEDTLKRQQKAFADGVISLATFRQTEAKATADRNAYSRALRPLMMWKLTDNEIDDIEAEANKLVDQKKVRNAKDEVQWARVEIRVPWFDKAFPNRQLVVVEQDTSLHDMIEPGKSPPLFKLADISKLEIMAHAPEEYLPVLREALQKKERGHLQWDIRFPSDPPGTPALKLDILQIAPSPEGKGHHSPMLIGYLANPEGKYLIGQLVTATIHLLAAQQELAIPASALVEEGSRAYVLVQPDPKTYRFALRPVSIVRRDRNIVHIISLSTPAQQTKGIQAVRPGEGVITHGAVELKALLDDLKGSANE